MDLDRGSKSLFSFSCFRNENRMRNILFEWFKRFATYKNVQVKRINLIRPLNIKNVMHALNNPWLTKVVLEASIMFKIN